MIHVPPDCSLCPLSQGRIQVVPGAGSPNAQIVFIGEGPGKNEDIQGLPFVGSSGKFLDELLDGIQLSRKDVFITNIVKCRPPNNRDPLDEEKMTCAQNYLIPQINDINPKIIVTLGRHSMNFFFPSLKISEVHGKGLIGKRKNGEKQYFFALYHPAVALYNGSMRKTLKEDFKKLQILLKKLTNNGELI